MRLGKLCIFLNFSAPVAKNRPTFSISASKEVRTYKSDYTTNPASANAKILENSPYAF